LISHLYSPLRWVLLARAIRLLFRIHENSPICTAFHRCHHEVRAERKDSGRGQDVFRVHLSPLFNFQGE
jgi:hypothetical protein